ncbi:MAG: hypothetical protein ACQEVA_03375 [Myxococcota bacterium]
MKTTRQQLIFALCAGTLLLWSSAASAGAWAQEDTGVYLKLSTTGEYATEQYKENGETFQLLSEDDRGEYRAFNTTVYGEFGLLPKLTAVTSGSFKSMTVDSTAVRITTNGLSDFQFGLKYQFVDEPLILSAMASGTFPMGYTVSHPDARTPALGNGVPSAEGTLLVGKSFYPAPVYASAQASFRYRGERTGGPDYPPEIPFLAEVGYSPSDWVLLRAVVDGNWGLGNPQSIDTVSFTPAVQRFVKVGPSAIFTVADTYQINVDYMYAPWGVNSLQSHQVSVGFALDTTL